MKYTITKKLDLVFEVEAESAQDAYNKMLDTDDNTFVVNDCQYEIYDADDKEVSEEVEL